MNDTIRGVHAPSQNGLLALLNNWLGVVEEYSSMHTEDACYWYNERATLGSLAAAAWRTKGWCALEEYRTEKRHSNRGRCDLYITTKETSYACEAKQSWQRFGKSTKRLEGDISKAIIDAKKLDRDEADKRLAATFCVPSHNNKDVNIEEWLNGLNLNNVNSYFAKAWIFPNSTRKLQSRLSKRIFPGVVLFLHDVERYRITTKESKQTVSFVRASS